MRPKLPRQAAWQAQPRRALLAYTAATCAINWLVCLRYLPSATFSLPVRAQLFLGAAYLGQLAAISLLTTGVLGALGLVGSSTSCHLRWARWRRAWVTMLGVTVSLILMVDSTVFAAFGFHVNWVLLELLIHGGPRQVMHATVWEVAIGSLWLLVVLGLHLMAQWWAHRFPCRPRWSGGLLVLGCTSLLVAHLVHLRADAMDDVVVLQHGQRLPWLHPATGKRFLLRHPRLGITPRLQATGPKLNVGHHVHYPQGPVPLGPSTSVHPDVVWLLIDTWRADMLNPRVTPHIAAWSQHVNRFTQHWSGGNCTQSGLFSLFYGLPSVYWDRMNTQHLAPVWLNTLQQLGYGIDILGSAPLTSPSFHHSIFVRLHHLTLQRPGDAVTRDRAVTHAAIQRLRTMASNPTGRPWFLFVFFDALHAYAHPPMDHLWTPEHPMNHWALSSNDDPTPYRHQYMNALHFVDRQVGHILSELQHLAQRRHRPMVVLLTSDHGEAFNDHHRNHWGHGSDFTDAQMHVPLLLQWPGRQPRTYTHHTDHADVVATLLQRWFHPRLPLQAYTIGHDLFTPGGRPSFRISSSYARRALIEPNRITDLDTGAITDSQLHPLARVQPHWSIYQQALALMQRY